MAQGLDRTGVPSVDTISLGGGKLFLAGLTDAGKHKKFREVGEVKDFSFTLESEKLDFYSAMTGIRKKKKSVVTQQDGSMSFAVESINFDNLAYFYSGDASEYANPSISGVTDAQFVDDGDVEALGWYVLADGQNTAYGITTTNSLVVESTNTTPVALVKDTDYTVDAVAGKIFLNDTATVQSIITAGDGLQFSLTADASATGVDRVTILSATEINVGVRFEAEDAESGDRTIYVWNKVTVSSDGDHSLQAEEWQQLPFGGSVEQSDYYDEIGTIDYPRSQ